MEPGLQFLLQLSALPGRPYLCDAKPQVSNEDTLRADPFPSSRLLPPPFTSSYVYPPSSLSPLLLPPYLISPAFLGPHAPCFCLYILVPVHSSRLSVPSWPCPVSPRLSRIPAGTGLSFRVCSMLTWCFPWVHMGGCPAHGPGAWAYADIYTPAPCPQTGGRVLYYRFLQLILPWVAETDPRATCASLWVSGTGAWEVLATRRKEMN